MRLDPLLDDGYAGDILSAVMKPRAAYLRLFPYCSPAALMVYQMASTPTCFLLYARHTPSPLFDKLQLAILHRKDGVASNETDQWPTVGLGLVYRQLHPFLSTLLTLLTYPSNAPSDSPPTPHLTKSRLSPPPCR